MYTLPLNFFFEPALSVISLTPTVFTNKISVALKAIRQCSHRQTDFGHNFGWSRWTSWYFPGWSLSGFKNEASRLLTYKIFWWKKITSSKSSKRTAWCKSGSRTPGPTTFGPGTRDHPQCLKVGPSTTSKFKSVTPSSFFNEFIFFRTFHVLFLLI